MAKEIQNGTFEEKGHIYKNLAGREIPSTTQILEGCGLVNFENIPGKTLEHKRLIGDSVHVATHYYDICKSCDGLLDWKQCCQKCGRTWDEGSLNWDSVHRDTTEYILAYQKFKREAQFTPEEAEQPGVFAISGMEFGFTRDRVGRLAGIKDRIVLEIKCSFKEEKSWKWQMASYVKTVVPVNGEHVGRVATQLKPDQDFKLYIYENPRDIDVFTWALALTTTKINEGIAWRKDQ